MKKLINGIVKHRKIILIIFLILTIVNVLLMLQVNVNYNMRDYLPDDVHSTKSLEVLEESFSFSIPNARVTFPASDIQEALEIKEDLKESIGIEQVLWLDDTVDISIPLELQDSEIVESFFKNGKALFQVTADTENAAEVVNQIYDLDPDIRVAGELVDLANAQNAVQSEMIQITTFVVPLVLIILLITTHAWLEPLIFGISIGVGIILNLGTNIFLGEISFISQAIAAVLQLAVSMDYAIFLLNRFNANRKLGHEPETAMTMAIKRAFSAISSSASTTIFGFLALIFMRFGIGADLGIVMAKGIVFSFISVMVFMPCLILAMYKLVDKTTHRSFLPSFKNLAKIIFRGKAIFILIAALVMVPSFLASRANEFIYGMGGYPEDSRILEDKIEIEDEFGLQQQMSLMVPKGNVTSELELLENIEAKENTISVITYVNTVDQAIPQEVLSDEGLEMLVSDQYTQFIITASIGSEGDEAFSYVEDLRKTTQEIYDEHYLIGESVAMLDMKDTIEQDDKIVNGLAILAIGLVILIAFRSLSLPLILVLVIEIAIWINLSVPYFSGKTLSYIGYLIISTVQLGATVDYAILYTEHYLFHRKNISRKESLIESIKETVSSLLPPALILTISGFILYLISSLAIVSELGLVLGRGAILSFLMVVFVLPGVLYFLDKFVEKTTWGLDLYKSSENNPTSTAPENRGKEA